MNKLTIPRLAYELENGKNRLFQVDNGVREERLGSVYTEEEIGSDVFFILKEVAMLHAEIQMTVRRINPHFKARELDGN